MKKKALKGLALNKKSVSNLNEEAIVGGRFLEGCTEMVVRLFKQL